MAGNGGIPFGRGALYYLLGNHFYIGEVKYKNEILPGEQPSIMDRAWVVAVGHKLVTHQPVIEPVSAASRERKFAMQRRARKSGLIT